MTTNSVNGFSELEAQLLSLTPPEERFKELASQARQRHTGPWRLDRSELWYQTEEQAKAYLEATVAGHYDDELELIRANKGQITEMLPRKYAIVDLGCGDGEKALEFIGEALGQRKQTIYVPVDVSPYLIKTAAHNLQGAAPIMPFNTTFARFDFAEVARNGYLSSFILLLGNTLGNFDPSRFLSFIKSSMKPQDRLLMGIQLRKQSLPEILQQYSNDQIQNFAKSPLLELGFDEEDLVFEPVISGLGVHLDFVVKKAPPRLSKIGVSEDDKIAVLKSYKPTLRQFTRLVQTYFSAEMYVNQQQSCALALCKTK